MKPNRKLFATEVEVPESPYRNLDEFTFEEILKADQATKDNRALTSDTFAALNALAGATQMPDAARITYETLIDAARRGDKRESKTRRFICAAWQAECHRTRAYLAPDAAEDEVKRFRAAKARNWRRYGWTPLHQFQRESHLALFEKEVYESIQGREKKPVTVYHDRLTDLLAKIVKRARSFRGQRVDKFNRAAEECLVEFRAEVEPYAPDWTPDQEEAPAAEKRAGKQQEGAEPAEIKSFRRSIQKWRKSNRAGLPEDLTAARQVLLAILDQEWPDEHEGARDAKYVPPPVYYYADEQKNEGPESPTSCPRTFDPIRENPNENTQNGADHADVIRLVGTPDPAEAARALEAFESVNVDTFEVTLLDETKPKGSPPALFETVDPVSLRKNLPRYLKRNETRPESVIIRVRSEYHLLQVDDASPAVMRRLAPFCFLQEWTSAGNGQCWMAIADEIDGDAFKEQRRRLIDKLKPTGANLGPSGSTRWPGSLNRKLKHAQDDGTAPRVTICHAAPGRLTSFADLDAAGLLAPEAPPPPPRDVRYTNSRIPDEWPDINEYLGTAGDRSSPEISWAMAALNKGWPEYAVVDKLKSVGPKAQTRRDKYAENTVARAARYLASSPTRRADAVR